MPRIWITVLHNYLHSTGPYYAGETRYEEEQVAKFLISNGVASAVGHTSDSTFGSIPKTVTVNPTNSEIGVIANG